ncbi:MAG TPA: lipid II flippase MurJ [Candidatus Saccharimonadales bacterium]|nr:lipid II flippase MurJ [Candidatus Saccharimonadales bacterium]
MQEKPAKQAKPRISLGNTAALLIATALIGQGLGFLRTRLVNANFNNLGPHSTDAYFAAFNIPDFFFYTLAAGALGVAFMPVLAEHLHRGDRKGIWELSSSLLNLLSIIMAAVSVIIFVFAEPLIHHIVAPHLGPSQLHDATVIMRFLALNPLLFTISGILNSVQQTFGKFFFFAIAPLFYNLSIIVSTIVFSTRAPHGGGPGHLGLVGLGIGALIGGILQLLVVVIGLKGSKFRWYPKITFKNTDFRLILRQLPARSIDQGIDQVESIVETNFATRMGTGSVTAYNNAYTLQTAPIMLIGTAISTAAFPNLANRLAQGRPDLFNRDFLRVLRAMIWITLPVVVVCYFCRGYLARLIFSKGSADISLIFGYLTIAIFFRTIYSIISRWFYAQKDTKTPLFVSIFTIALNIVLASILARPSSYGVAGLALSQSIVAMVEVIVLSIIMLVRERRLFSAVFWSGCFRIVSVTGFSVVVGFIMVSLFPLQAGDRGFVTLCTKLVIIAGSVLLTHVLISSLFGLEEVQPLFARLKKLIFKPIKIQY